jgi:hypothetical protein
MIKGYVAAPYNAWAGWRLKIPGGPVGGQYHGYLANQNVSGEMPLEADDASPFAGLGGDSRSGWSQVWHGTPLREGETLSDYVYRSPAEMPPRPNASGGVNTVRALQTMRSAGYAEAPGNYAYLGAHRGQRVQPRGVRGLSAPITSPDSGAVNVVATPKTRMLPAIRANAGDSVVMQPIDELCPSWGCGINPPVWPGWHYPVGLGPPGATATVPQPPPPQLPVVSPVTASGDCAAGYYRDAAGNCTNDWRNPYSLYLPPTVGPSPTVPSSPSDYLPSQGQAVPGITPGCVTDPTTGLCTTSSSSSIMDWLSASTIWASVPNGVLVAGAALAMFALGGKRR